MPKRPVAKRPKSLVLLKEDGTPKIRFLPDINPDGWGGYRGNHWIHWILEGKGSEIFCTFCPRCHSVFGWTWDFGQLLKLRLKLMKMNRCPRCHDKPDEDMPTRDGPSRRADKALAKRLQK